MLSLMYILKNNKNDDKINGFSFGNGYNGHGLWM